MAAPHHPEPDYLSYSLKQLERVHRRIDKQRFPERLKLIEALIAHHHSLHTVPLPQRTSLLPEQGGQEAGVDALAFFLLFAHQYSLSDAWKTNRVLAKRRFIATCTSAAIWIPPLLYMAYPFVENQWTFGLSVAVSLLAYLQGLEYWRVMRALPRHEHPYFEICDMKRKERQ